MPLSNEQFNSIYARRVLRHRISERAAYIGSTNAAAINGRGYFMQMGDGRAKCPDLEQAAWLRIWERGKPDQVDKYYQKIADSCFFDIVREGRGTLGGETMQGPSAKKYYEGIQRSIAGLDSQSGSPEEEAYWRGDTSSIHGTSDNPATGEGYAGGVSAVDWSGVYAGGPERKRGPDRYPRRRRKDKTGGRPKGSKDRKSRKPIAPG